MKKVSFIALLVLLTGILFAQSKEAGSDREATKQYVNNKEPIPTFSQNKNVEAIKSVLKQYNSAVEKLDLTGTEKLFTADSKIYESGGSEGNYAHYLEHHLTPELKEFKSFTYSDCNADIQVEGNFAFSTETYKYTIVLVKDNLEIKRKGIATSVLKKVKGEWKIMISHNSSRK